MCSDAYKQNILNSWEISQPNININKLGEIIMSQVNIKSYLIENYHNKTVTEMAKELGIARGTVTRRAKELGLEKEITFVKEHDEVIRYLDEPLNLYFITNKGRVVNSVTNKILKPKITANGYWQITFQINGKRYEERVHRILAKSFIPNPDNKPHVNHIDGDKLNYSLDNLEWVTPKENAIHASENGLLPVGEKAGGSKISEKQAMMIINALNNGERNRDIVKKYHFATRSIVEKIRNETKWKHLTSRYLKVQRPSKE